MNPDFMNTASSHTVALKTYRHYSIAPAVSAVPENKKYQFFYIGKRTGIIDSLIKTFDSGYAADNAEHARAMLAKLLASTGKAPDVIIAEGNLGHASLLLFHQFMTSSKLLNNVPFFVESEGLTSGEINAFASHPFADDLISLTDLGTEKLIAKMRFWKRIRQKVNAAKEPLEDEIMQVNTSPAAFSKRVFDIVASALLMVILSPLFLIIIIALKIQSKEPVFYTSKRAGKGYKIFDFYKFRTMHAEANNKIGDFSHLNLYNPLKANGPLFIKIDNDPRITRLGALLRKCSMDELPQLWNVFKGDMSLVGNRPLPLYEAATLTTDEWSKRFLVPAGMTGLWQIKKKTKYTMSAEERINLDINYADKSNFLFDLWIMANTPYAVIQRTNA